MDQVMDFIDVYWGVSILGGLTVGTLINTVWISVKNYFSTKTNNVLVTAAIAAVDSALKKKDEETYAKAELILQNEYLQRGQVLLFKYINYLTVASKLDGAQKIELVQEAQALQIEFQGRFEGLATVISEGLVEAALEIISGNQEVAVSILDEAINSAGSLLDNYTEEE